MSMMVSFCVVLFPRDDLGEILDLIESVSEGFPTYPMLIKHSVPIWNQIQVKKLHGPSECAVRRCSHFMSH